MSALRAVLQILQNQVSGVPVRFFVKRMRIQWGLFACLRFFLDTIEMPGNITKTNRPLDVIGGQEPV